VLGRQAFIYVGDEVAGGDKIAGSEGDRPHPAGLASLSAKEV
jgi:hypothetical protein